MFVNSSPIILRKGTSQACTGYVSHFNFGFLSWSVAFLGRLSTPNNSTEMLLLLLFILTVDHIAALKHYEGSKEEQDGRDKDKSDTVENVSFLEDLLVEVLRYNCTLELHVAAF